MSESSVPFDSALPASASEPARETAAPSSDKSKLLLLGGVAGVVLLGVLAYFLFFAGGSEEPAAAPPATPVAPAAPSDAAEPPAAAPQQRLNAKSFGRDPFHALIVEAAAVQDPAVDQGTTSPSTDGSTSTVPDPGTTDPTGTTSGTSSPATTSPHSFRVLSVAPDNSTITVNVDGKRYANLRAGEVFATYFKVRLISGASNSFQYGEERFNVLGNKRLTIA
jgi:hypothetical protein